MNSTTMFVSSEWNLPASWRRNLEPGCAGDCRQTARVMRNSCTRCAKFRAEEFCIDVDETPPVARTSLVLPQP
jgi:hypothetical protein